jgi:hypothetical protein
MRSRPLGSAPHQGGSLAYWLDGLHLYGIDAHAGRNTARLALAAEIPAAVLADLTGISVSTAECWSQWAKRDWAAYVGQRTVDDRRDGSDGQKLTNPTR